MCFHCNSRCAGCTVSDRSARLIHPHRIVKRWIRQVFKVTQMGEGEGWLALSCQLFLSPSQTLVLKILLSDFVIIHNGDSLTVQSSPEDGRYVCALKVWSALPVRRSQSFKCSIERGFSLFIKCFRTVHCRCIKEVTSNRAPLSV